MNTSAILETERLLRKYGYTQQAGFVREFFERINRDDSQAYQSIANLEWWGGSGSIADVHLYREGMQPSDAQNQDNRNFRAALLVIHEEMRNAGISMARADSWAEVFREWQRNGI